VAEMGSCLFLKEFRLYQIYPNPFNLKTTIIYDLPMTSDLALSIYNVIGKKTDTLLSEKQSTGQYQIE
jgi:hypothetical protein